MANDSHTSLVGKQRFYQNLIRLLTNRLLIEEYYRQYPEIAEQRIDAPIFITGLPRTGTSFVQQLLALEPSVKYLSCWECDTPCPPPQLVLSIADPRIQLYQKLADIGKQLWPELHKAHPVDAGRPEECQQLLAMDFKSASFTVFYLMPEYQEWLLGCDMGSAYAYHQSVLKLLQWRNPNGRWVLKAPMHMRSLGLIHEMYPDAKIVICHRESEPVISSNVKVSWYAQSVSCGSPDRDAITETVTRRLASYLRTSKEASNAITREATFDLDYAKLVDNPIRELRKVVEFSGMEFSWIFERRVTAWLKHGSP
jgi:hypothetical protein